LVLGVDGEVLKTNEWKPLSSLGLFRKIERAAQHLKSKKKDLDKMTTREKRRGSSFYPVFEFRIEQMYVNRYEDWRALPNDDYAEPENGEKISKRERYRILLHGVVVKEGFRKFESAVQFLNLPEIVIEQKVVVSIPEWREVTTS